MTKLAGEIFDEIELVEKQLEQLQGNTFNLPKAVRKLVDTERARLLQCRKELRLQPFAEFQLVQVQASGDGHVVEQFYELLPGQDVHPVEVRRAVMGDGETDGK